MQEQIKTPTLKDVRYTVEKPPADQWGVANIFDVVLTELINLKARVAELEAKMKEQGNEPG